MISATHSGRPSGIRVVMPARWIRIISAVLVPVHLFTAVPTAVMAAATDRATPPASPAVRPLLTPPDEVFAQQPAARSAKRTVAPVFAPPRSRVAFSDQPTDAEITTARIFEEPIVPTADPTAAGENAALAHALQAVLSRPDDLSPIEGFLADHGSSRWRISVGFNLGRTLLGRGMVLRSQRVLEEVLVAAKGVELGQAAPAVDRAIGELAQVYVQLRAFDRLDTLVASTEGRVRTGTGAARLHEAVARAAYVQGESDYEQRRCGPLAIRAIFRKDQRMRPIPAEVTKMELSERGARLSDLVPHARQHGLDLQVAFRSAGAPVLTPAVIHWKYSHYTALLEVPGIGYVSREGISGVDTAVSARVLDEEASGYCLVPTGQLPEGWRSVGESEAVEVFGMGITDPANTPPPPCEADTTNPCVSCSGMAVYNFETASICLLLMDNPVGYAPPVGPSVQFTAHYNHRESAAATNISNLGNKWCFDWLSYVRQDATTTVTYGPGGGQLPYSGYNASTGEFAPQLASQKRLVKDLGSPTPRYTLSHPDGTVEVFDLAEPGLYPRVFRTKLIDPQGNTLTFAYDENFRLRTVTDAIDQVTVIDYELSANPVDPAFFRITRVTDPFGRYSSFAYNGLGQLESITDVIGITSSFAYGTNDFVNSLTTPYGTTTFIAGDTADLRYLEATDPAGTRERVEWRKYESGIPGNEPSSPADMRNEYLQARNTFYWDKKAMSEAPGDVKAAQITHWLHGTGNGGGSAVKESTKAPFENRVWYMYPGQTSGYTINTGTSDQPSRIARLLDDGTEQRTSFEYNTLGRVRKVVDPLGRETVTEYATNGLDVLFVRQKNGAAYDTLSSFTYNGQHLPLTATDAAGQTTTFTYNAAGQTRTITNAKNETTTFWYHPTGQPAVGETLDPAAIGYLVKIDGPLAGESDVTTFAYDDFGRVRTTTDSENYSVVADYDSLNRPTRVTYPDTTYSQVLYDKLDASWTRDRLGRWTHTIHDKLRRPSVVRDSEYRATTYTWCDCGSLESIEDPAGNRTTWIRDLRGRVLFKVYPDKKMDAFGYELTTSRLKTVTDAKGQVANYRYFLDNALRDVRYTDLTGAPLVPATPTVSYTYDSVYGRVQTMTDGIGTTTYGYYPITTTPALGAGRLATVDGPWDDDTITYGYDELGRVSGRTIAAPGGSSSAISVVYDTLGRVQTMTNVLGTFSNTYVGATGRIDFTDYPNGQRVDLDYHDLQHDFRLKQIKNLSPGSTPSVLSQFDYTYDVEGRIATWTRAHSGMTDPQVLIPRYDGASQLRGAVLKNATTGDVVTEYAYGYDLAGNRTEEQIGSTLTSSVHNALNQLTAQAPGGQMEFTGTVSEPATVAVGGQPATVDGDGIWRGRATVAVGANSIPVTATDPTGNTTNKTIFVTVAGGAARTLNYDAVGNLTADGVGRTFGWDAANRLRTIGQGSDTTEFIYDGQGRRVIERLNGAEIKRWIWADGPQPVEERDATNTVTRRFVGGGEQVVTSGTPTGYFYTADHLGSVREMTDATGTVRARYDYDPYGRLAKLSGDLEATFGFAGFYRHQQVGLSLTRYRAYDSETGRWLSRDPIQEEGGLNLYAYVSGNPVDYVDPLGLWRMGSAAGGAGGTIVAVRVVAAGGGVAAAGGVNAAIASNPIGWGVAAFAFGFAVGTWIDRQTGFSTTVANWINGPEPVTNMAGRHESGQGNYVYRDAQYAAMEGVDGKTICEVLRKWMEEEKKKGRNCDTQYINDIKKAMKKAGCYDNSSTHDKV